jgi:hypothetical protein
MPNIGGRYSALSYFGLAPAALMGVDIAKLLNRAENMVEAMAACVDCEDNPGAWLGTILAEAYKAGHNKVTITTSPVLDSFGLWVEQLIAESTGKEGKGLVPVTGEPIGRPSFYGNDRLFVYIHVEGSEDRGQEHAIQKLEDAGQPVIRLNMHDTLDLGGEFFRWEFAIAVAGVLMGIDPFDEPNVQESKDYTKSLLETYERQGKLPPPADILTSDGLTLIADQEELSRAGFQGTLESGLRSFFGMARPGDYVAFLAYIPSTGEQEELLLNARLAVRDALRVATTFGYGPRFLHSTGQLHKGGSNRGLFIQLTAGPRQDLPIPGEAYTFGTLLKAQADGDMLALRKHGRRVIRLHINGDLSTGAEHFREAIRSVSETFIFFIFLKKWLIL